MKKSTYTYTVLRYLHDTTTGEFVNIGVLVSAPDATFLGMKVRRTYGRMSDMFVGFDVAHFKFVTNHIQQRFEQVKAIALQSMQFEELPRRADGFATMIVPPDDSSFQWSPVGSGLTDDPDRTLESLYIRMIEPLVTVNESGNRSDDQVWNVFKNALHTKQILSHLQRKTIEGADDSLVFEHALKNGKWHGLIPVSFDVHMPSAVMRKAHALLGNVLSVAGPSTDEFVVYFLVGAPNSSDVLHEYDKAKRILDKSPVQHKIFEEKDAHLLADHLVRLIDLHVQAGETHEKSQ